MTDLDELPDLMRRWDEAALARVPRCARLVPEAEARGSILRAAASEEEIAAAEARLGVRLPPQYRRFLSISNGANAGEFGANCVRDPEFPPSGLLPVEQIVPLAEGDPITWKVWMNPGYRGHGEVPPQGPLEDGVPVMMMDASAARDALLISHPERYATLSLVPAPGEWQVWRHEYTGPDGFASISSWLRYQLRRL